jgi:hypothetical protein
VFCFGLGVNTIVGVAKGVIGKSQQALGPQKAVVLLKVECAVPCLLIVTDGDADRLWRLLPMLYGFGHCQSQHLVVLQARLCHEGLLPGGQYHDLCDTHVVHGINLCKFSAMRNECVLTDAGFAVQLLSNINSLVPQTGPCG